MLYPAVDGSIHSPAIEPYAQHKLCHFPSANPLTDVIEMGKCDVSQIVSSFSDYGSDFGRQQALHPNACDGVSLTTIVNPK